MTIPKKAFGEGHILVKFCTYLSVMVLPLAACGPGPDQPDNIPLVGKWEDSSEMTGVDITGMPADIDDIPEIQPLVKKFKTKTEFCGEPLFRDKGEFQEQLDRVNSGKCELTEVANDGSSASASGKCTGFAGSGFQGSADFSAQASIGEDSVTMESEIAVQVSDDETGEGESVTIYATRKMTRIGDC